MVTDYAKQSNKKYPFEGLTIEEKKKLVVYLCYLRQPVMTVDDIERRWGVHVKIEERLTVFEALELVAKIKKEIKGINNQVTTGKTKLAKGSDTKVSDKPWWQAGFAMLFLAVTLFWFASIISSETKHKEAQPILSKKSQNEPELKDSREVSIKKQEKLLSDALDIWKEKAKQVLLEYPVVSKSLMSLGADLYQLLSKYSEASLSTYHDELTVKEMLLSCYKKASSSG